MHAQILHNLSCTVPVTETFSCCLCAVREQVLIFLVVLMMTTNGKQPYL